MLQSRPTALGAPGPPRDAAGCRHRDAAAVLPVRGHLACRSGADGGARRSVRLAAGGHRAVHLRRRPSRRRAGRASRRAAGHAHPHPRGDPDRDIPHRRRHDRRRHRPDPGARHDVRRHHDHDERHGRPLPVVGRTAARAAGVQPRRGARLSRGAHSAIGHRAHPAEPHGFDVARRDAQLLAGDAVLVATLVLYAIFLGLQTMRHRGFFQEPDNGERHARRKTRCRMAMGSGRASPPMPSSCC